MLISDWKILLQVRIELTTSASLAHILPYKYRALSNCATGAPIFLFDHPLHRLCRNIQFFSGRKGTSASILPGVPQLHLAHKGGLWSAADLTRPPILKTRRVLCGNGGGYFQDDREKCRHSGDSDLLEHSKEDFQWAEWAGETSAVVWVPEPFHLSLSGMLLLGASEGGLLSEPGEGVNVGGPRSRGRLSQSV